MAHVTALLADAANRIGDRHAGVVADFARLTASAAAGTISAANAEAQARALGKVREDLEVSMDAVLRLASAELANILMSSILAEAEALA